MPGVDYLALSLIMLLAQFSPGPDMLLLLRNSLRHPAKAGLWTVLGIACGLSVHLTVVLVGLGVVIRNSPTLYPLLLMAGALWIGRLGVLLLKSASVPAARADQGGRVEPLASKTAFLQGLLTNLSNVKAMLFLGGTVLQMLGNQAGLGRRLAFFGIIIGQALVFWSLFVFALQHPRVRRLWDRSQQVLTAVFGFSLLILALSALWQGMVMLLRK